MKCKEIDFETEINYIPLHDNYGRAEFEFCPQFFRGKIRKLFILARQQVRKDSGFWVIDFEKQDYKKCNTISFESWQHKGIDLPKIWLEYWCKEHKALCHRIYVPNGTSKIKFDLHFGDAITVRFED